MSFVKHRLHELENAGWPADESTGIVCVFVVPFTNTESLVPNQYAIDYVEPHKDLDLRVWLDDPGGSAALPSGLGYIQRGEHWMAIGQLDLEPAVAQFASNYFTGRMRSLFVSLAGDALSPRVMMVREAAAWVLAVAHRGMLALQECGYVGNFEVHAAILRPQNVHTAKEIGARLEDVSRQPLGLNVPGPIQAGPVSVYKDDVEHSVRRRSSLQPLLEQLFPVVERSTFDSIR